ncbi:MAG TPA: hypothetical protein VJS39_11280 [Gemmatimonadaceae bacterium]|nr:hypothetical protein [Gemmatimonadaceae bacterium]
MNARNALLNGLVDYAGLFPPAGEDMSTAVRNYAEYSRGPDRAALGRFIVPLARLSEFETTAAPFFPTGRNAEAWRVSVLVADDVRSAVDEMSKFNAQHAKGGRKGAGAAVVDVAELKATTVEEIANQQGDLPRTLTSYFEIPLRGDAASLVRAIGEVSSRAKIRTGGVTPDAFPSAQSIIDFMMECHAARVPFKATAGLHHPIRAEYKLTYDDDSPRATMYGFLNVFLAAALIDAGENDQVALGALQETDSSTIEFHDDYLQWRDKRVSAEQLSHARTNSAISFGSCSFREPIDELASLVRKTQPSRT